MNFQIDTFMTQGLQLKNTELLVYALVHNFSQDGEGCFYGSVGYAAKCLNCTGQAVRDAIKHLTEKGLLINVGEHPVRKTNQYIAFVPEGVKNFEGGQKFLGEGVKNFEPIINSDNKYIERDNNARARKFIRPSVAEVAAYCRGRNNGIDAEAFCDHYNSNGWKVGRVPMTDWKAAVRNWERKRKENPDRQTAQKEKESNFAYMMRVGKELRGLYGNTENDSNYDEQ